MKQVPRPESNKAISPRLRELVNQSVAILGEVIQRELGEKGYHHIETLRRSMAGLRGATSEQVYLTLDAELKRLATRTPEERLQIARAYTLMLELMNACENAYRSHAIRQRLPQLSGEKPQSILYVLTAHPTEARSPENIWIFHRILAKLISVLEKTEIRFSVSERQGLFHDLEIAWRLPMVRGRKPRVQDEAEHVYTTLLRDETLTSLLACGRELAPVYVRSWVGGDKDGHPGVDAEAFADSLQLSRKGLIEYLRRRLAEVRETLTILNDEARLRDLARLDSALVALREVGPKDGKRIVQFRERMREFLHAYEDKMGALHASLIDVKSALHVFPALVVPIEFRESSDVLLSSPTGKGLAIFAMLKRLAQISSGGHPRWYVRGLIVSMASELEHLQVAAGLVKQALGAIEIPVIPLFEQYDALNRAVDIISALMKDPRLSNALKKNWDSQLEVMLGYSDSSKESGVLQSRLKIAETMHDIDHLCRAKKITPIFFQGSGGSVARGGGTIPEQTAWWSSSALRHYKVTIQGEMVERSLANPEITRGQLERIVQSVSQWKNPEHQILECVPELDRFAERVAQHYKSLVTDPNFLSVVERATPYSFLDLIKFGSRPNKRAKALSVSGLRAIPWILCWTQTRTLMPTWWGIGTAWQETPASEKKVLLRAAQKHPLMSSFIRVLGFTLATVEMEVFRLYLENSDLPVARVEGILKAFESEKKKAVQFVYETSGINSLLPSKPWLAESIGLRSPMIHPLNLLQIIAMKNREADLLRLSVAGISAGMLSTG